MKKWAARLIGTGLLVAAGITATAMPVAASNGEAYAPNSAARSRFCSHSNWWYNGYKLVGVANNGFVGTWRVVNVYDSPHSTEIDTVLLEKKIGVIFYC